MQYIALRDFDGFKKGDSIPEEIVQDRLIRGKKIGLVSGSESVEIQEVKEELITEQTETFKEELLLEDSSSVTVEVQEKEEIIPEVLAPVETKETKKTKK